MMNEEPASVFSPGSSDGVSHAHGNRCSLCVFECNCLSCINFRMYFIGN